MLLDGKLASAEIKKKLRKKTDALRADGKRLPHLVAILVGTNGASETYVSSKVRNCEEVGFISTLLRYPVGMNENELLETIEKLNEDDSVDGILVQLPLPSSVNENKIINAIAPEKDVDGFHPLNVGKLTLGLPGLKPATPLGILLLLQHYDIRLKGKHVCIIGRSNIVGRPLSILLSSNLEFGNATVTLCHIFTENLVSHTLSADIVVVAVGIPGFLKKNMIREGAVVIDVGITRVEDAAHPKGYHIVGDADFEEVKHIASAITPVPGGVGLMTIAGLLMNTFDAYQNQHK